MSISAKTHQSSKLHSKASPSCCLLCICNHSDKSLILAKLETLSWLVIWSQKEELSGRKALRSPSPAFTKHSASGSVQHLRTRELQRHELSVDLAARSTRVRFPLRRTPLDDA
ncbi:hypothetical protein Bca4012_020532 [Brassica carinata]